MQPWEDNTPVQPATPAPVLGKPWEDVPGDSSGEQPQLSSLKSPDTLSKTYRAVIEGGALTAGSMAGGAIGTLADPVLGPAGTIGGAVAGASAFYPAGKYVADAIDKIRGVATEQQSLPQQMATGAKQELLGQAIGAVSTCPKQ